MDSIISENLGKDLSWYQARNLRHELTHRWGYIRVEVADGRGWHWTKWKKGEVLVLLEAAYMNADGTIPSRQRRYILRLIKGGEAE